MDKKVSIRMSGLGGQGVVTAAHIIGSAANKDGKFSTVNPFFGAEKRLAPAESYVRISEEKIYERGEILFPDVIMIFHPHVITLGKCYTMPFYEGLQENGIIIINSDEPLEFKQEDIEKFKSMNATLYHIPATRLGVEVGGTELSTNMAMIGSLLGVYPLISVESLKESLAERFGGGKFIASGTTAALDDALKGKYDQLAQLIEKNMEVIDKSSEQVRKYTFGQED